MEKLNIEQLAKSKLKSLFKNKSQVKPRPLEEKVPKLLSLRGEIVLVGEYEFKTNRRHYLLRYGYYGWYKNLKLNVGEDLFIVNNKLVNLEEAYAYAKDTNLEAGVI